MNQYKKLYPEVKDFFSGYFHQDWKYVYDWEGKKPSFEFVVYQYKRDASKSEVIKAIQELEHLLKYNSEEEDIREILNQLGSSIYAPGLGLTYQEWLKAVLTILKDSN